jgi:DNA-directed RNA polymerase specialized sigma24 family protein
MRPALSFENLNERANSVIEDHVGWAITIGREFCTEADQDDMASEALLALTAEIRRLSNHPEIVEHITDPKTYLRCSIYRHLVRAKAKCVSGLGQMCEYTENYGGVDQQLEALDTIYDLFDLCESDFEMQVVELRTEGMSDYEIANLLGKRQSVIQRTRKEIRARYDLAC